MSYCRCSGESDVYCYGVGGGWEVIIASDIGFNPRLRFTSYKTRKQTVDWLLQCRDMGLRVPQTAIDRLLKEMENE